MSFARCLLFLACLSAVQATVAPFDPLKYQKTTARCRATRRGDVDEVVDIQLKYVDVNPQAPSTILMVHGWPSLWSTWSYQIQEFEKDYHLVAPNLRGFGDSTHPGEPQTSGTMADLVGDLVCVLEDAKVASAICMGHDWGSSVCYEAARLRPDIFTGVVGLVVPYLPQGGPFVPIENLLPLFPTLTYQLFFDRKTDEAIAELDKDVRRSLRATLRTADSPPPESFLQSGDSFLAAWDSVKEIEPIPFFSPEEENYFVEQFSIQGFKDTLGFYSTKNRHQSWELAHSQGNFTLSQPVLAVYPMQDPVANWVLVSNILKSAQYIPNLDVEAISGAHWVHLENAQETNRVIRSWLEKQRAEGQGQTHEHQAHLGDEL